LPRDLPRAPSDPATRARLLARALSAGFPDRVGRREGGRVRMAETGAATCPHGPDAFVVVADVERVGTRTRARALGEIPADWLVAEAVAVTETRWTGERVEVREELRFGALVLEGAAVPGDSEAVAAVLAEHVVGSRDLDAWERAQEWIARVAYLRRSGVEVAAIDESAVIRHACLGCRALSELRKVRASDAARALLGAEAARVDRLAPEFVALPGRARAPVRYTGDAPCVSSRMQDFFGLREGPSIHGGPLVLELLAPNGRPVQVTRDLAGFWTRHWPQLRKELMRRYPRHRWPEDPLARVHSP
jgi:ATP-dependent helicase HrpB